MSGEQRDAMAEGLRRGVMGDQRRDAVALPLHLVQSGWEFEVGVGRRRAALLGDGRGGGSQQEQGAKQEARGRLHAPPGVHPCAVPPAPTFFRNGCRA